MLASPRTQREMPKAIAHIPTLPRSFRYVPLYALLGCGGFAWSETIEKSMIETAILIHHEELTEDPLARKFSRQRRADVNATAIQQDLNGTNWTDQTAFPSTLASTMKGLFKGAVGTPHTNVEIATGLRTGLEYLRNNRGIFNLNSKQLGLATGSLVQAALEASAERVSATDPPDPAGLAALIPDAVIKTFVPTTGQQDEHVPELAKDLTEGMAQGAMNASFVTPDAQVLLKAISEATVKAGLEQMKGESVTPSGLIISGFEALPGAVELNATNESNHVPFHPGRTRFLEYAVNGLAYGAVSAAITTGYSSTQVPELAKEIGSGAAKAAVDFLSAEDTGGTGGQSLFTYEVVKTIASGVSLGAVMVSSSHAPWKKDKIPELVAERVAYGISSSAMDSNLQNGKKAKVHRLGEAAAFGASMGTQFATVFDGAADYEFYGKKTTYDRVALAEASSKGAAKGSIEAAASAYATDANVTVTNADTGKRELLDLARGTTMGSVLSNVAMAVYYEADLQRIVQASSKGGSYGTITADHLHNVEKERGKTEEFEVEIARAAANGASTGALFEVVGLLDAKPDIRRADVDSIATAKSATFGSTLGAILGGDLAGQDSIAIKQAVEQGATEGSLDGVALALGIDETNVGSTNIKSSQTIKNAVGLGNKEAALKAAEEMSTKSIQPSALDMQLLMQKYGISPRTTNPAFVFPNPKKSGEEDFLFEEKFPVATPIM